MKMKIKRDSKEGYTIVEVLMATALIGIILSSVLSAFILTQRFVVSGSQRIDLQNEARSFLGRASILGKEANNISVLDSGNKIRIRIDENTPLTTNDTADDTITEIYFDNGDGSDTTIEDNTLKDQSDTVIAREVSKIGAAPVFTKTNTGVPLEISFRINRTTEIESRQEQGIDIVTKITLRNEL